MNKENKTILLNQLRIMSAVQRLEFFVYQQEIEDDLSEGIKDTQKVLYDDIDNKISMQQENTNLKQAINKIRKYCNENIQICKDEQSADEWECCIEELQGVLQIIDKVLGDK